MDFGGEYHVTYQLWEARPSNNSLRDVVLNNREWFSTDMVFAFAPRNQVPDTFNHKAELPLIRSSWRSYEQEYSG